MIPTWSAAVRRGVVFVLAVGCGGPRGLKSPREDTTHRADRGAPHDEGTTTIDMTCDRPILPPLVPPDSAHDDGEGR